MEESSTGFYVLCISVLHLCSKAYYIVSYDMICKLRSEICIFDNTENLDIGG